MVLEADAVAVGCEDLEIARQKTRLPSDAAPTVKQR